MALLVDGGGGVAGERVSASLGDPGVAAPTFIAQLLGGVGGESLVARGGWSCAEEDKDSRSCVKPQGSMGDPGSRFCVMSPNARGDEGLRLCDRSAGGIGGARRQLRLAPEDG